MLRFEAEHHRLAIEAIRAGHELVRLSNIE
jgi:hypothetical protein